MTNDRSVREGYPLLWKDKYTVKSYDVDQEKRITLMSLFNCFQESASHHAERCDFGYKSLREKGKFWVLSRLRIEIDRLLLWEEPFTVETWSKGAQGIFALRDFLVVDSGKIAVARAFSCLSRERGTKESSAGHGWGGCSLSNIWHMAWT